MREKGIGCDTFSSQLTPFTESGVKLAVLPHNTGNIVFNCVHGPSHKVTDAAAEVILDVNQWLKGVNQVTIDSFKTTIVDIALKYVGVKEKPLEELFNRLDILRQRDF